MTDEGFHTAGIVMAKQIDRLQDENKALRALNTELVEAAKLGLEGLKLNCDCKPGTGCTDADRREEIATILAKAKGEQP